MKTKNYYLSPLITLLLFVAACSSTRNTASSDKTLLRKQLNPVKTA